MSTDSELSNLLDNFSAWFQSMFPGIALSLLILILGLAIAWIVRMITKRALIFVQKKINSKVRKKLVYLDLSGSEEFISKTFFWIIILLTLALISQILKFEFVSEWMDGVIRYLPNIVAVILIIFFGIIGGKLIGQLVSAGLQKAGFSDPSTLSRLVQYIILFVSIIIALGQIGIEIYFLTDLLTIFVGALLFSAALAFGLGARDSVRNILGSYYLQKNYKEGYTVRKGEIEGTILKITSTSVILKTKDGQVTIPAGDFNNESIVLIHKD
jgi:hypothetical protein